MVSSGFWTLGCKVNHFIEHPTSKGNLIIIAGMYLSVYFCNQLDFSKKSLLESISMQVQVCGDMPCLHIYIMELEFSHNISNIIERVKTLELKWKLDNLT
jgi:hypothetical protein